MKEYVRIVNGREYKQTVSTKTISVPILFYDEVKRFAQQHGVSVAKLTRDALEAYMEKKE